MSIRWLSKPPVLPEVMEMPDGRIVFRCRIEMRMYRWPCLLVGASFIYITVISPSFLIGLIGVLYMGSWAVAFLLFSKSMLGKISYAIDGGNLILHHQFNTKTIPIDTIFKVRRGKFWVERDGKNYSAAYTKLRIHYGKNQYVYVSPADEARFLSELQKINPSIAFSSERGVNS